MSSLYYLIIIVIVLLNYLIFQQAAFSSFRVLFCFIVFVANTYYCYYLILLFNLSTSSFQFLQFFIVARERAPLSIFCQYVSKAAVNIFSLIVVTTVLIFQESSCQYLLLFYYSCCQKNLSSLSDSQNRTDWVSIPKLTQDMCFLFFLECASWEQACSQRAIPTEQFANWELQIFNGRRVICSSDWWVPDELFHNFVASKSVVRNEINKFSDSLMLRL